MSNLATIFVFCIVWWLVLFTTLPFGIKRIEDPKDGADVGAPEKPRLWWKMGITTLVSGVIAVLLKFLMDEGIVSFKNMSQF